MEALQLVQQPSAVQEAEEEGEVKLRDPFKLCLGDVLFQDEIEDRWVMVRNRIIAVFHRATVPDTRKYPTYDGARRRVQKERRISSGNAIHGCPRNVLSALAHYILGSIKPQDPIFLPCELTPYLQRELSRTHRENMPVEFRTFQVFHGLTKLTPLELVVWRLRAELIEAVLQEMCRSHELYWIENEWQIVQSAVDQYLDFKKAARSLKKRGNDNKFDRRNYHGRPREQSRRRGVLEGTSIGRVS